MTGFSIDAILFTGFLLINLIVGLIYGQKVKTLRDYAVGDKKFSTLTIASTIVATWASGSIFVVTVSCIYKEGLSFVIICLGNVLALYFVGKIAIRVGEFLNNLSVAECMGSMYGSKVRIISAICGLFRNICLVALQFKVAGSTLQLLFGLGSIQANVAAASIVIFYSALGGIKAVTFTDVMQFLVFGLFLPTLIFIIWKSLQSPGQVVTTLQENPIFSPKAFFADRTNVNLTVAHVLYVGVAAGLNPAMFQRIMLARDVIQVKSAFNYATLIFLIISVSFIVIAVLLLAADPNINPDNLIQHMINTYAYKGFKGFMAIGLMAMVMSTADSYINASAVLFTNDLAKPFKVRIKSQVLIARLFAVFVGAGAFLITLTHYNFLALIYLSASCYIPIVTAPLLLAIFGFRTSSKSVLIGMAAGFIAVVIWRNIPELTATRINSVVPGMFSNWIFLLLSHYILKQPGGWIGVGEKGPIVAEKYRSQRFWRHLFLSLKRFNIFAFFSQNLPKKDTTYLFFGLYVLATVYLSFYTIPTSIMDQYDTLIPFLAISILGINSIYLTYPFWNKSLKQKKIIGPLWAFGTSYILFFSTTLLMFINQFHLIHAMLLMTNLILGAWILRWSFLLLLGASGFGLALYAVNGMGISFNLNVLGLSQFIILYSGMLFFSLWVSYQSKGKKGTYYLSEVRRWKSYKKLPSWL